MTCEITLLKAIIFVFFLFPPRSEKGALAYLGCITMTVEHSWQLKGTDPG